MGINTLGTKESQDKKYDDKKGTSAVDKVVNDTKDKVKDVHGS